MLNQKRGLVFEEAQRPGTPIFNLKVPPPAACPPCASQRQHAECALRLFGHPASGSCAGLLPIVTRPMVPVGNTTNKAGIRLLFCLHPVCSDRRTCQSWSPSASPARCVPPQLARRSRSGAHPCHRAAALVAACAPLLDASSSAGHVVACTGHLRLCVTWTLTLICCVHSVFDHWEQMTYDPLKVRIIVSCAASFCD